MKKIAYEIAERILSEMPKEKKEQLKKALMRNMALTSVSVLEFGRLSTYKEGWYLILEGTRCKFSVWAGDNDGEFIFGRKPNERFLHKLYDSNLRFKECDFLSI